MKQLLLALGLSLLASVVSAADISFSSEQRRQELQQPAYASIREDCLAAKEKWDGSIPEPISALHATAGYGSDNSAEPFVWAVMLLGGRALAGEEEAAGQLRTALRQWAEADAFADSEVSHDTYYALKRLMLPVVVNFAIVAEGMKEKDRHKVEQWIDKIIRPLDRKFGPDVNRNNHRALADSVLMAWGAYTGDDALYQKGIAGYHRMLREARADGALPLETRRGARALWYQRHAIASLVLMAEIAHQHGDDLYSVHEKGVSLETIINYFLTALQAPIKILPDAAENYIPGPSDDYLEQDREFLKRRGHGRHYMAFAEAYRLQEGFAVRRLQALMDVSERPLIDEYFGGNASCFFRRPGRQ